MSDFFGFLSKAGKAVGIAAIIGATVSTCYAIYECAHSHKTVTLKVGDAVLTGTNP